MTQHWSDCALHNEPAMPAGPCDCGGVRVSNVVKLKLVNGVGSRTKIAANKVLSGARGKLTDCVVLGYTTDGDLYAASTDGPGDTMWLIEHAKKWLLEGCPSD